MRKISVFFGAALLTMSTAASAGLIGETAKGSTDYSVELTIIDLGDGTRETGVVFDTPGIDLWYRREGGALVPIVEATLAALTTAHTDGGFLHISDGVYRVDLEDAAVAAGADFVSVGGEVTGMIVIGGRVKLTDVDMNDSVRAGLTALPNAAADAAGGLPISDLGGLDLDGVLSGNVPQTGDSFARIGVNGAGLTNIDLPNQTMDITGTLSGSVGSVTGAVGSVTGNVGGNVVGSVASVTADVGVNEWNGVLLATTNPLPNAAPGANLGLPTVDATNRIAGVQGTINTFDGLNNLSTTDIDNRLVAYDAVVPADLPTNFGSMVISGGGAVDALVQGYLNNTMTEVTAGRIAGNHQTFWANADAATASVVDDVSAAGSADWSTGERNEIRGRLGITGTTAAGGNTPTLALEATVAGLNNLGTADIDARLVAIGLDHLVSASVADTDITDNSIFARLADDGVTADWTNYNQQNSSLEALRARGDAAWTTGSGTGLTAIASGTAQAATGTTLQLAAGETFADDELIGAVVQVTGGTTGVGQSRCISDYTGSTDTATVATWTTTPTGTITYEIAPSLGGQCPLDTGTATTLNVTASGNVGIDWANVENPTSTVGLTNTTVDTVTTNTDMRGTDNALLASSAPTNWSSMVVSGGGAVDALVQGYLNNTMTEVTAGRIAGNHQTFWANADAATASVVDDVSAAGSADWTTGERNEIRGRLGVTGTTAAGGNTPTLALEASVDDLEGRLTAARAGFLDNLNGHVAQTGDSFARIGVAGAGLTNIDLPNQTMDITGNLSGSVGSISGVTFPTNFPDLSITATTGRVDVATVNGAADTAQTGDSFGRIGAAGAGLTGVPWNSAWDAEAESEVTDALNTYDPPTRAELTADVNSLPTAAENATEHLNQQRILTGTCDSGSTTTCVDDALTQAAEAQLDDRLICFDDSWCALITGFTPGTDTVTTTKVAPSTRAALGYTIFPATLQ